MPSTRSSSTLTLDFGPLPDSQRTEKLLISLTVAITRKVEHKFHVSPVGISIDPKRGVIWLTYWERSICRWIVEEHERIEKEVKYGV